jgi:hypothetical protein
LKQKSTVSKNLTSLILLNPDLKNLPIFPKLNHSSETKPDETITQPLVILHIRVYLGKFVPHVGGGGEITEIWKGKETGIYGQLRKKEGR